MSYHSASNTVWSQTSLLSHIYNCLHNMVLINTLIDHSWGPKSLNLSQQYLEDVEVSDIDRCHGYHCFDLTLPSPQQGKDICF